jgi:hypothetical protein
MPALDPQTALLATIGFPVDPQTIAPIALAAAAVWLLFGDKIRSVGSNWGRIGSGNATGGDLQSLVAAADLLIRHFDKNGDDEGSQAARIAAGRLFAAREAKP